jgi:hypothetical protein
MNYQARAAVLNWQQTVNAAWGQQPSAILVPAPEFLPTSTRKLTPDEIALARSVFGDTLDTSQIELSIGGPLGIGGFARTLPDHITFPDGTSTTPSLEFNSWLIHELTHVWQYQRGHRVIDLLPDAIHGGIDPEHYEYGDDQGLRDASARGKTFSQFNYEQQGDILADYYVRRETGGDTSAFEPFVNDVRDGDPPVPWWVAVIRNLGPRLPP